MNNYFKCLLLVLCCFLSNTETCNSQQIIQLDSGEGLVNGTINTFEKDSLGYMWIGTDQGLNRYSGAEFKNYFLTKNGQLKQKGIIDLLNLNGDLYAISSESSLFKYNYESDKFEELYSHDKERFLSLTYLNESQLLIGLSRGFLVFDLEINEASDVQYNDLFLNRYVELYDNVIYSATARGLYSFTYSRDTKTLKQKDHFLENKDILHFNFDHLGRIWVGTEVEGLFIIKDNAFENIPIGQVFTKTYAIRKINFDKNNNALVAVDRLGLFVLNDEFEIIQSYSHSPDNDNSISQNSIYACYVDNANAYWLGVREGGINIVYEKDNVFSNIRHIKNVANSINNNNIRSIFEADNGDLWFGTENGVSKFSNNRWENYSGNSKLYNTAVLSINEYKQKLILGTYGEGLLSINSDTGNILPLELNTENAPKFVFNIRTFDNNLWISASDGPLSYYYDNNLVNNYPIGLVRSIVQGYDEIIYAISDSGFYEINKRNGSIRRIKEEVFNTSNRGFNLNFDQLNNCIWIGSKNGLHRYNLSDESLENFNDLVSQEIGTVFSIEKDNMQNLYLASISGLWRYNIKKKIFRKFDSQDGLDIDEFGPGASFKFKDSRLGFGGPKGAVIFNPIDLVKDQTISDIYLTNLKINGKTLDSAILSKNINYTKNITLNYDKNSIAFNYETIKFHGSKRNLFEWKLEGYDTTMVSAYGNKEITYSNLNPGKYILTYTGYNADGIKGQDNAIEIIIKNPFWKTWWAYCIYLLLMSFIIYLIFKISKANNQKRFDENRIKFFIEVAHDIRTPVSLIQLLVKQLANQENVEKSIELIQRNSQNLNEYVSQLLDFQKIDKKQLKLAVSKVDLKDCLSKITSDFTPILQERSIDIVLDMKHIPVWFDVPKMNRIFYNLVSNAIKYSNEGGEIKIKAFLDDKILKIDFIDNGIGIPEKQQELIFKRFTRGTNVSNKGIPGTGIGLMLSKKIVELHGGRITLESKENIGSKFTIELPSGSEQYTSEELYVQPEIEEEKNNIDDLIVQEKLILLVEDNEELRQAIKNELEKKFKIIEAPNGKEGLLLALSKNPDLIITDVMMPKMDGKELCHLIKTNFKTSHIPVIMLTALADIDDKIKGLETGADAYVEKPFNVSILNATINNLIKSRENVSRLLEDKEVSKQLTPDESFLSDVIKVIKDNLTERDFSIDTLCETMGLSRSNLFRKLKGLIQMSPSDLIIKIKLTHAEELMKKKVHQRISDIAYESGFHDPKYFSTLFKKHYSKTPKEYIDSL